MATNDTITKCIVLLSTAYPRQQVTPNTAKVYREFLGDLPDDLLIAAVGQHISISKWWPTIAELREAAREIQARAEGIPTAGQAWGEILTLIRCYNPQHRMEEIRARLTHPVIEEAVRAMGGWAVLGDSTNTMADRAHFLKVFDSLVARHMGDVTMLPGVREAIRAIAEKRRPELPERAGE